MMSGDAGQDDIQEAFSSARSEREAAIDAARRILYPDVSRTANAEGDSSAVRVPHAVLEQLIACLRQAKHLLERVLDEAAE